MPDSSHNTDHLGKSVACALGAAILLSGMNVISKIMVIYLDPVEIAFWRNLLAMAILLPMLIAAKRFDLLKTKRWKGQFFRAIVGTVGMILAVWMFSLLSLAEGVAISFTAPLFVVLLSRPILKEAVGLPRMTAALIGFMGVLVIAQPWANLTLNMLGVAVGLGFAMMNASVMLCLRWLGDTEHAVTTVFYFLFIGLIGTGIAMPFIATPIPQGDWWMIGVLGLVGLASLILKTESYRWGKAAVVAPLSYSLLLWAILFDWWVWDVVPDWNVLIGAFVIIGSNGYILWREQRYKRASSNTGAGLN